MADFSTYPGYVVARLGNSADIPALLPGELGFDEDTKNFRVGDGTPVPPKVPTDKGVGTLDFSGYAKWTLPGGLEFDTTKPGQISGVKLADLNKSNGFLVRRGQNSFGSVAVASTDETILIASPNGETNQLNLRLNANSTILRGAIQGLVDTAIEGLQDTLFNPGPTPPNSPQLGSFWYDTDEGTLYMRVTDGTVTTWLDLNS